MPMPAALSRVFRSAQPPDEQAVLAEIARLADAELALDCPVEPGSRLARDLGLDSLGLTLLVVGLEDAFRVTLPDEEVDALETVQDLAHWVLRRAALKDA